MADVFSKDTRSRIMSKIRGKDTKPELLVRKALFRAGYRYRLRYRFKEMNFRPDIVMVSKRVCIFVDGCFWHGCPRCYRRPKTHKKYWIPKIKRNMERDKQQDEYLKKNGWKVIRIWEHDVKEDIQAVVDSVARVIDEDKTRKKSLTISNKKY